MSSILLILLGLVVSVGLSSLLTLEEEEGAEEASGPDGEPIPDTPDEVTSTYRSAADDGDAFNVDLAFIGDDLDAETQQDIQAAAETISDFILGDREAADVAGYGTVDDFLVEVSVEDIDGAGNAVAVGAPDLLFNNGDVSISGRFIIDSDDLDDIVSAGTMETVAVHEMLHALGFGAYNVSANSYAQSITTNDNGDDVYRSDLSDAVLGGQDDYPGGILLSDDLGHWDEALYGNEIMTVSILAGADDFVGLQTLIALEDAGYDTVLDNPLDADDLFDQALLVDGKVAI